MIDHKELLVSVVCTTYNHEAYVRQTLEGFVMQKTNFSFEVIVHDDASTDSTVQIIKEYESKYPNLFRNIYQIENQYSQGKDIWGNLFCNYCAGKYIAICEGDDYWIDPLKLQKQVDFLEANPEYGMCYTQCKYFYQKGNRYAKINWGGPNESFIEFWNKNSIPTLTVVFRKDLYFKYTEDITGHNNNWLMGDYPMWLWFAYKSKIKFINEVTGIYRVLETSASHTKSVEKNLAFLLSSLEIKEYFNQIFNYGKTEKYFERSKWLIQLRSFSLYSKYRNFTCIWISGVCKHPTYLFYMSTYKYFLFFIFPGFRRKRI